MSSTLPINSWLNKLPEGTLIRQILHLFTNTLVTRYIQPLDTPNNQHHINKVLVNHIWFNKLRDSNSITTRNRFTTCRPLAHQPVVYSNNHKQVEQRLLQVVSYRHSSHQHITIIHLITPIILEWCHRCIMRLLMLLSSTQILNKTCMHTTNRVLNHSSTTNSNKQLNTTSIPLIIELPLNQVVMLMLLCQQQVQPLLTRHPHQQLLNKEITPDT